MSHDVPIEQLNEMEISEQETLLRGKKRKAEEAQLEDRHVDHDDNSRGQLNEKDERFGCASDSQNVQVPSQHKKRKLGDSDAIYTGYSIPDHIPSVTNCDPAAAIVSNTNIRGESNQNLSLSPAEISFFNEIVATSLDAARTHLYTSHQSIPHHQHIPHTRQELLKLIQDVEEDASDFFARSSIREQLERIAVLLRKEFSFTSFVRDIAVLRCFNRLYTLNKPLMVTDPAFDYRRTVRWLLDGCQATMEEVSHIPHHEYLLVQFKMQALHMLGLLARNEKNRERMLREGSLSTIVHEIKYYAEVGILERACFAFGNIINSTIEDVEEFHRFIVDEQILQATLRAMRGLMDNPEVVKQVCFVIGNIAFTGDYEEIINQERGIELVVEAMRRYDTHPALLTEACFFLKNMCYGEAGRTRLIQAGGVPAVIEAMNTFPEYAELLELACNVFYDLSFTSNTEQLVIQHGGLGAILRALTAHSTDLSVLNEATRTLGRLYSLCDDENKCMFVRQGAVEAIISAIKQHPNETELHQRACWSFYRLSKEKLKYQVNRVAEHSHVPSLRELSARIIHNNTCNTSLQHSHKNNNSHSHHDTINNNVPTNTNNNNNDYDTNKEDTMDVVRPDLDLSILPLELQEYLHAAKSCTHCHGVCFSEFWELIRFVKFEQHDDELPVFTRLCSMACLNAVKAEPPKNE
jgi:hypothetical protein